VACWFFGTAPFRTLEAPFSRVILMLAIVCYLLYTSSVEVWGSLSSYSVYCRVFLDDPKHCYS
jgi:hypothetical protein